MTNPTQEDFLSPVLIGSGALDLPLTLPEQAERAAIGQWERLQNVAWLHHALPSACRIYHTGFLAIDREEDVVANGVAVLFNNAQRCRLVLLFQRRLEPPKTYWRGNVQMLTPGIYDYIAVRTTVPVPSHFVIGG